VGSGEVKKTYILAHQEARRRAVAAVQDAPEGYVVTLSEPTRNSEQNSLLWVILTAFSRQLVWPVNGAFVKMSPEEWKDVLSSAYRKESARLAMGLDGGVVMLGMRTSQMGRKEFSEFVEFLRSVAADRGVELDEVTA
jgi:hypothetical protein